jgi:hypothetical protein
MLAIIFTVSKTVREQENLLNLSGTRMIGLKWGDNKILQIGLVFSKELLGKYFKFVIEVIGEEITQAECWVSKDFLKKTRKLRVGKEEQNGKDCDRTELKAEN